MNEVEITCCMLTELAKLVVRSNEKTETLNEGRLKFLNTHSHAFADVKALAEKLDDRRFDDLSVYLWGEEKEPCYLPFTPGNPSPEETASGFLVHIFKGEQEIVPLSREKIAITQKQYYRLFHTLRHDLKRLEQPPAIETWLYLLQRYTKWIPAGTNRPHISLYDAARVKMALRACIAEDQLQRWWEKREAKERWEENVVAFYAVRIWGKDDFFTQLDVQSNLKVFKGGIYYLQMVKEYLARSFLEALDLPLCNCLYEGEDGFLLMVPAKGGEQILRHHKQTEQFLLRHFRGVLGIGGVLLPMNLEDLKEGDFSEVWDGLWESVEQKKSVLFQEYLTENPQDSHLLFGPFQNEEAHKNSLCSLFQSLEKLGDMLAKARWSIITSTEPPEVEEIREWQDTLAHFKVKLALMPKKSELKEAMNIYRFGNTDFACPQGRGFKFSDILPYLVGEQVGASTPPYWCIINLRIDKNLRAKKISLVSYLTEQEYLRDFFRTYLASLLREKRYRKYTCVLYTAGHKLTIVASPQISLMLANQVAEKFRKFTGENFTLSGRLSVFPSEYPLHQALYQEQKKFALQSNLSNRIVIMDENVSWSFLESLLKSQEKLSTIAKLKGKRFLFSLWGVAEHYRLKAKKSRNKKDSQLWRHIIHYYLVRLGITENVEVEKGPVHLSLAIRWNQLMSQEGNPGAK